MSKVISFQCESLINLLLYTEQAQAKIKHEDINAVLKNRARNSSLGFDSVKIVSGENPKFLQPFHEGSKSIQGMRSPWVTLAAVLNEVVAVQYIGNKQINVQNKRIP